MLQAENLSSQLQAPGNQREESLRQDSRPVRLAEDLRSSTSRGSPCSVRGDLPPPPARIGKILKCPLGPQRGINLRIFWKTIAR